MNRHGARIQVSRPLRTSQTIHVINQNNEEAADFRVVGPVSPPTERVGEWGVECIEEGKNIWGIYFPPPAEGADARALLECRQCHAVSLVPLSLVELEVLETAGILSKPCAGCGNVTPSGFPEKQLGEDTAAFQEMISSVSGDVAQGAERRQHPRNVMQVPARVRDFYGISEATQTENTSKEGFCFLTDKKYHVGQGVMVACPYNPSDVNVEIRAHIVREQAFAATGRILCAVRYDQQAA